MANGNENLGKAKNSRQRRKIAVFVVELVVIVAMVFALVLVFRLTGGSGSGSAGPLVASVAEMTPQELGISERVLTLSSEGGVMNGYLNVALFGIDALSTDPSDLLKNYRSDAILVASINRDTGEIRLVSVYRDTYLNLSNDTYNKCNAAYSKGGAVQAISMLNSNLDLDITDWVSVSYKALSEVIDALGGVYIEVEAEEIGHLNNYQIAIAQILGTDYTPLKETGYQKLNGIQACAYCRIRYTAGDDFKRTERQRKVISSMMEQAKKADAMQLVSIFESACDDIYTSVNRDTLLEMLSGINSYYISAEGGFPEEHMRSTGILGPKGSCVIPTDLENNVIWLHKFLFDDENYTPSGIVKEYSEKIKEDTSKYISQ